MSPEAVECRIVRQGDISISEEFAGSITHSHPDVMVVELDTITKRVDVATISHDGTQGVPMVELVPGENAAWLHGLVETGVSTLVSFPGLAGWTILLASRIGRYTIGICLVKKPIEIEVTT